MIETILGIAALTACLLAGGLLHLGVLAAHHRPPKKGDR